jgi:mono/diheme cytochrome c family protein
VIRLLFDPNGLAAGGDEPAIRFVKAWGGSPMPGTEGLTRQMAEELVAYIEKTAGTTSDATAAPKPDLTFTGDDRARGLAIFVGRQRLANSGAACVSCHAVSGIDNVRGGRLGPDLTGAHARLGGASGTMAWLARPPTPLMRSLYRHKSLTEDEARAVTALLTSDVPPDAPPGAPTAGWLLIAGIAGALLAMAVLGLASRRRLRPVRRGLLHAAMHSPTTRSIGPEGGRR